MANHHHHLIITSKHTISYISPTFAPKTFSPLPHLDTSAWTAAQNDLSQYLEVDLGQQYNISAIGTQGRQHTIDYVSEFRLESGIDGHDYNLYRDRNGNIKVHRQLQS